MRGELAENFHRKDFTPEESVDIWNAIEPLEREAARERMTLGKISTGSDPGKTRDKVAAVVGVSGRTMEKRKAIVEAARSNPEQYGKLLEDMNRTGRADGPAKRLKVAKQAAFILKETPPLPGRGP